MSKGFHLSSNTCLVSDRLKIRKASLLNICPSYLSALNDPEVTKFTEIGYRKWSLLSASKFLATANRRNHSVLFSILTAADSKWIGNVRLFNWRPHHQSAELSFIIFEKDYWGQGLVVEAVSAVLQFAADRLGVRVVLADYWSTNQASSRVFKKLDFKEIGVVPGRFLCEGERVDSVFVSKHLFGPPISRTTPNMW